jgi:hypothetical protein
MKKRKWMERLLKGKKWVESKMILKLFGKRECEHKES